MWNRILLAVLILTILGTLAMIGYTIASPKVGETFTEFYILGSEGKAANYPINIQVGKEEKVTLSIVNQEHRTEDYRVEVRIDGVKSNEAGPIKLQDGEKWEQGVSFTPQATGTNQKVEFLLFLDTQSDVYRELHLIVNITD